MEQTKTLPPLVSDDLMYASSTTDRDMSSGELRRIYEADRAKTREVVQRLVDALDRISTAGNFLSAAAKRFMDDPSKSNNGDLQLSRSLWVEADCALDAALSELEAQPSAPTVEQIMKVVKPHIEMRGPMAYSDRCYDLRARLTKLLTNP